MGYPAPVLRLERRGKVRGRLFVRAHMSLELTDSFSHSKFLQKYFAQFEVTVIRNVLGLEGMFLRHTMTIAIRRCIISIAEPPL